MKKVCNEKILQYYHSQRANSKLGKGTISVGTNPPMSCNKGPKTAYSYKRDYKKI